MEIPANLASPEFAPQPKEEGWDGEMSKKSVHLARLLHLVLEKYMRSL